MFNQIEKKYILDLAHRSIDWYFLNEKMLEIEEKEINFKKLKEKLSCFVTLTIDSKLRGCVGHIESTEMLYLDIIESAYRSAFFDDRFLPLSLEEFKKVKIEVSVLSKTEKLKYSGSEDLIKKLRAGIDGVVIRKGEIRATYLPQVWSDFSSAEDFLSSLCLKAGLGEFEWKSDDVSFYVYQVEKVE